MLDVFVSILYILTSENKKDMYIYYFNNYPASQLYVDFVGSEGIFITNT